MVVQRNPDGFSALAGTHPLAGLDIGDPFKWTVDEEDFTKYSLDQTAGTPYTFTQTNCIDTIDGPGGVLVLTLGGADNDLGQLQKTTAPFQTNSKKLYMQARFKLALASGGTIAANEMFIGLASLQTGTAFFAGDGLSLTADDMLGFYKLDTEGAMSAITAENDNRSTDAAVLTPTDGEWQTVAIYYDGAVSNFYAGNQPNGSDMILKSTLSGNDATSVLSPTLYIKGGEAKANVLHIDYINVYAEK